MVEFNPPTENPDNEFLAHPTNGLVIPAETNQRYKPSISTKIAIRSWESQKKQDIPPPFLKNYWSSTIIFIRLGIGLVCGHHSHTPPPTNGDRNDYINSELF